LAPPRPALFALDLDGTLLDSRGKLVPANREAVAAAIRLGAAILICTGRGAHTAGSILALLPAGCYAGLHNGALLLNPAGGVMRRAYLDAAALANTSAVLLSEGLEPMAYVERETKTSTSGVRLLLRKSALDAAVLAPYLSSKQPILEIAEDVAAAAGDHALGVVAFGEPPAVQRAVRTLSNAEQPLRCWGAPFGGTDALVLEAVPSDGTKAAALTAVAAELGISLAATVAVGDNLNDLDMLQTAGVAVAMGNAVDEAKRLAAWTTSDNNSAGVAVAIRRLLGSDGRV
jgi:hydroxymethylpyrimidine pyrophosphatase-like HAD family hydrolase